MWINEVMAGSMEESYGLNLEWISEEGISEEICGVDKDGIVVPSSPGYHKVEIADVCHFQDNNDYIEIQVTEEEVVTDEWQVADNGVDEEIGFSVEGGCGDEDFEDDQIPMIEEEQGEDEEYSRTHPYRCDFCSRRFTKKSSLSTHLLTHETDASKHRCHLCGAQYKSKTHLVDHMKIHSYVPIDQIITEDMARSVLINKAKKKSKKKKCGKWETHRVTSPTSSDPPQSVINSLFSFNSGQDSDELNKLQDVVIVKSEAPSDEELFLCSPEEEEEDDLDEKFPVVDPSRPYVCQHCGVGFAREKALMSHTMVHLGDSAYECDKCHDMFSTDLQLKQHQMKKHSKCFGGGGGGSVKKSSQNTEEKFKTFQCDRCDASFIWYNQLKRHQRNDHLKEEDNYEEKYVCHLCNITFKTEGSYIMHKELHDNTSESTHFCNTCGQGFMELMDLHSHMKSRHKWGHICHVCGSAYRDAKSLTKHLLTHAEVPRSYPCPTCQRLFYNRGKLKKHMEVAHEGGRTAVCSECGECFCDAASLAAHRQSTHGSGRLFPCTQCGKTFTSRSSQQIHVRVHTGEKPYGCRFCWKAFADGGTLRKHERIHTGEKPYVCPVCTKAFNQRVVLREHVRAHHSGLGGRGRNYECIVCGETFGESLELCAHLVMHSDENTAKHRLPNTSTRKYNRRRKRTPNRSSEDSDSAYEFQTTTTVAKKKVKGGNLFGGEGIAGGGGGGGLVEGENSWMEKRDVGGGGRGIRTSSTLGGKRGSAKGTGGPKKGRGGATTTFSRGRGKVSAAAKLMTAGGSYASRYVVSQIKEEEEEEGVDYYGEECGSSRAKGVDYQLGSSAAKKQRSRKWKGRKELSTISSSLNPLDNSQYINGIDPNIFEEVHSVTSSSSHHHQTCIVDDIGVELKLEVRTSEGETDLSVPTNTDTINPDIKVENYEMVSCEICSEMFYARSDLLKHIEVHI